VPWSDNGKKKQERREKLSLLQVQGKQSNQKKSKRKITLERYQS